MVKGLPKASILTFGCQMNEHDSRRMGALLENIGYQIIPFDNDGDRDSDVVLINTCSVREKPQEKLSHVLTHLKNAKKINPKMSIIVTGCVAQQRGRQIIEEFPAVDAVIGPDGEDRLVEYLREAKSGGSIVDTELVGGFSYKETLVPKYSANSAHAYITVVKGCDSFCSYCIVPYVRGGERSRTTNEVVEDTEKLISKGITSITLLGQNIARFGRENKEDLPTLLRSVSKVKGLKRLSFLTSHPKDFSSEIIKCYEDIENLCPSLHLPAQHGSNKILKAMNRGYTREEYLKIVDDLKRSKIWDSLSLTTDIILGFPEEDEKDFELLLDLLQEAQFDNSYSFVYSPRPGTVAYEKYGADYGKGIRKRFTERLNEYQVKQKEMALFKNKRLEGKVIEALVEGSSEKDPNKLTARTSTGKVVNFLSSEKIFPGSYAMVKIVRAHPTHLSGELVNA